MKVISHLNNKGQLTLPKTMRDVLGVNENEPVELLLDTKKREVKIRSVGGKEDDLDFLKFLIQNENLIVLIQGASGSGKTELIKTLTKNKTYKGFDKSFNFKFQEDGDICIYDEIDIKELDKLTIPKEQTFISSQSLINVDESLLFRKANRPILEIIMTNHQIMSVVLHDNNKTLNLI